MNKISGKLLEKKTTIYSRKFELTKLRQKILNEHAEGGLMRLYDDEHYDQLTANELKERYVYDQIIKNHKNKWMWYDCQ